MSSATVVGGTFSNSVLASAQLTNELATQTANVSMSSLNTTYTNGTGSGQVNNYVTDDNTLAALGSKDYDLDDNSTITNINGEGIAFSKIKMIIINNTGTGALTVDGDFLSLSTNSIAVPAGGKLILDFGTDGQTVTATTADVVTVTSSSGTTYEILFAGVGT